MGMFPCIGAHVPDFASACPDGWSENSDHFCISPDTYVGPCVGKKSFARYSLADRAAWGAACGVNWPPRTPPTRGGDKFLQVGRSCVTNYNATCPLDWSASDKHCAAPVDYEGACSSIVDDGKYRLDQKHMFAIICNAQ